MYPKCRSGCANSGQALSQQRAAGPEGEAAGRRFSECSAQAGEAIGTLLDSGALTSLGTRFVQEMRESLHPDVAEARGAL